MALPIFGRGKYSKIVFLFDFQELQPKIVIDFWPKKKNALVSGNTGD